MVKKTPWFSAGGVYDYLARVLTDHLHAQREPLALCLALLQYDKELASSSSSEPPTTGPPHPSVCLLHQYYSKWLPQQSQEALVGPMLTCAVVLGGIGLGSHGICMLTYRGTTCCSQS